MVPWLAVRNPLLDLPRGLVTRRRQKRCGALSIQMRRDQAGRREMEIPAFNRRQQLGELSHGPGHGNSFVRDALGEAQYIDAVAKHRGTRLAEIEPSRIDLREMRNQFCLVDVIACYQFVQPGEEPVVRKVL